MSLDELRTQNIQNVTEKALVCFIKNGITNTKVSEIAKAAGLTERSVYRYFPTKSDIVISAAARFSVTPVLWQLFKSCDTQSSTEWTLSIISISPRSSNLKSEPEKNRPEAYCDLEIAVKQHPYAFKIIRCADEFFKDGVTLKIYICKGLADYILLSRKGEIES